jgi:hypothetical protein
MKLACFYYAGRGIPIDNPVETKALQRAVAAVRRRRWPLAVTVMVARAFFSEESLMRLRFACGGALSLPGEW